MTKKRKLLHCQSCGITTKSACECGVGYMSASAWAIRNVKKPSNAKKSNRALAEEIGVSDETVNRARKACKDGESTATFVAVETPDKRMGRDGKMRTTTPKKKREKEVLDPELMAALSQASDMLEAEKRGEVYKDPNLPDIAPEVFRASAIEEVQDALSIAKDLFDQLSLAEKKHIWESICVQFSTAIITNSQYNN